MYGKYVIEEEQERIRDQDQLTLKIVLALLAIGVLIWSTTGIEERCAALAREYPDAAFRVRAGMCQTQVNGHWWPLIVAPNNPLRMLWGEYEQ